MTATEFNARYPVGTPVRYWPVLGGEARATWTRNEAWALADGTPVVTLEGISGAVALDHVCPDLQRAPQEESEHE